MRTTNLLLALSLLATLLGCGPGETVVHPPAPVEIEAPTISES